MSRLAGKFAGIVVVTIPDQRSTELVAALEPLRAEGLLDITAEVARGGEPDADSRQLSLHLVGHDRPGIVHEISRALAQSHVSIEDLQTATVSAPMSAETLFEATAHLRAPAGVALDSLRDSLEELANELMVDIELTTAADE